MSKLLNILELAPGYRYVFFTSLYSEESPIYRNLAHEAQNTINNVMQELHKTDQNSSDSLTKMDQALNFLKAAASFERSQEIKFFSNFKNNFPEVEETFNIDFTENNLDINFIIEINKLLKGANEFKKELNTELNRINRRREADNLARKGKKNTAEYFNALTDNQTKINASTREDYYLTTDGRKTFESILKNNSNLSDLTNIIIEKYGQKLFSYRNGKLLLNGGQIASLIKIIIDKAYQLLIIEYGRFSTKNEKDYEIKLQNIAESKELQSFIDNILNNENLGEALLSIADQHGIQNKQIQDFNELKKQINQLKKKLYSACPQVIRDSKKDFDEWREKNGMNDKQLAQIVQAINEVNAQLYYTGEDMSLIELISNNIGAVLGGRANPTDDIEAGKLILNIDIQKNSGQIENIKKAESKLLEQQREHFSKITKTTTVQSFIQNTEVLRDLRNKQNKILSDLKESINSTETGLNYLLQHINIHTTIKGYISAGQDSFKYYGGFEGAAFGTNLIEELNIIQTMLDSGGISMIDAEWLYQAMLNAGKNMIGSNNKHALEDYFSAFIGFLMFNDAALMVEDVGNFLNNNFISDSQDIHLYQLNGIYVPNSFILQKTYEALANLPNSSKDQGITAKLHTYDGNPIKGDWVKTSQKAAAATKLEMKFLAGFLDILDEISKAISF